MRLSIMLLLSRPFEPKKLTNAFHGCGKEWRDLSGFVIYSYLRVFLQIEIIRNVKS